MRLTLPFVCALAVLAAPAAATADLGAPVTLDPSGAPGASAVELDVDPTNGRGAAVWIRGTGTAARVVVRRRAASGVFGDELVVSESGAGAELPDVAIGSDGTIVVAYLRNDGAGNHRATAATLPVGSDAFTSRPIAGAESVAVGPAVVVGQNGQTTVAYSAESQVLSRTRALPGAEYEAAIPVPDAGDATEIDLALGGNRESIVFRQANEVLQASSRVSGLAPWEPAEALASPEGTTGVPVSPRVAVTSDGVSVATYQQPQDGLDRAVRISRGAGEAQNWINRRVLSEATQNGLAPKPATAGTAMMIVLEQGNATGTTGYVTVVTETSPAAPVPPGITQQTISDTNFSQIAGPPDIDADANGNAIAGWFQQGQLWVAVRPGLGEFFGDPDQVEASAPFPAVGLGPDGPQSTATALWLFGGPAPERGVRAASGSTTPGGGAGSEVRFRSPAFAASESQSGIITIDRPAGGAAGTVRLRNTGGTATPDDPNVPGSDGDYGLAGDISVPFNAGQDTISFPLSVRDDDVDDDDETVQYTIDTPTGDAAIGDPAVATVTIADTDSPGGPTPPTVSIEDEQGLEGDALRPAVRLSAASSQPVRVTIATANGSAAEPADYTARSEQDEIPAGQTLVRPSIPTVADSADEPNETFTVALSSPANATLGRTPATMTIVDDDPTPTPSGGGGGTGTTAGAPAVAPGGQPTPQGVDPQRFSFGAFVPIADTRASYPMPDWRPKFRNGEVIGFSDVTARVKNLTAIAREASPPLNLAFDFKPRGRNVINDFYPRRADEQAIVRGLEKATKGGQILATVPGPGQQLSSTAAEPASIDVYYFDPAEDRRFLADLRKAEDDRRREELSRAERTRVAKCRLLAKPASEVKQLLLNRPYHGTKEEQGLEALLRGYGCDADEHYKTAFTPAQGITTTYAQRVRVDPDRALIYLTVVVPRIPELAMTLREDPSKATAPEQLSLSSDWRLPIAPRNKTKLTVQVSEIRTGRFVPDVQLQVTSEVDDLAELPKPVRTDANGEVTIELDLDKQDTLDLLATYTGANGIQLVGFRPMHVRNLGDRWTTASGRPIVRRDGRYVGEQADLAQARGLSLVPANLGNGVGGAGDTRPAEITKIDAFAPLTGGAIVAKHNGIDLGSGNVTVAAGPGVIASGGGNIIASGGGNLKAADRARGGRARFLDRVPGFNLIANFFQGLFAARRQNVGNVSAQDAQKAEQSANALAQSGVIAPSALVVDANRIGLNSVAGGQVIASGGGNVIASGGGNVIASGGGNVIASGGGNVIASGGGNVIASGGGNVIASGGGNVIASGGGNLLPVGGGQVIASGGGNVIASGGGN